MSDQSADPDPTQSGSKNKPERDALSAALDAVNDRWSLHVVRAVAFGAHRFTDILREVGAPRDVLTARLRHLTDTGILRRRDPERGRLAGYELTQKGHDLGPVILVLKRWGDTYRDDANPRLSLIHDCGAVFEAHVVCQSCARPLDTDALSYAPGRPAAG